MPNGYYMPYHHWIVYTNSPDTQQAPLATFQDNAIHIVDTQATLDETTYTLNINWQQGDALPQGDYKLFLHIYDDIDTEPIAQRDLYPGGNTLPPGNWTTGIIEDRIAVQLGDINPGQYQVALGFYEASTGERLLPTSTSTSWHVDDNSGRLFIDPIEIPDNG